MTHLYIDAALERGQLLELPTPSAHHVRRVLRLSVDTEVTLFNGRGPVFAARISRVQRERVEVEIGAALTTHTESPLVTTLVQSISRGERMDYTLQKAVELGITHIVPVISTRTVVRLDDKRRATRLQHWRGIVQHAAEQCGRRVLPTLSDIVTLEQWCGGNAAETCFVLHPVGAEALARQPAPGPALTLVAGPEGGFDAREIENLEAHGVRAVALGPRILRTETAAVCALAVIQALWGDLG